MAHSRPFTTMKKFTGTMVASSDHRISRYNPRARLREQFDAPLFPKQIFQNGVRS
jgi:hypothetical protein